MAGYIGKSQGVTQVDGYNRSEADAEFVQVTGDTMTGALAVNGNLTVDTNTLFVDAVNNRVGVGTATPEVPLEIRTNTNIGKDEVRGLLRLTGMSAAENAGDIPSAGTALEFYNAWSGGAPYSVARISGRASQTFDGGLQFDVSQNGGAGETNFTTAMTILDTGRIGVGTSAPLANLEAFATDASIIVHHSANSRGGIAALTSQRFALASTSVNDNIVFGYAAAPITSGSFVERVRITNSTGDVYLDRWRGGLDRGWENYPAITIANDTRVGPQSEFRIHGMPGFSGGDYSINLRIDGSYLTLSDERAKTDIQPIEGALQKVLALNGKSFKTVNRSGDEQDIRSMNGRLLGFIAQEIKDVLPEVTTHYAEADEPNEAGYAAAYSVDYSAITAVLVEAIKEQQEIIEALTARVAALEGN